MNNKRAIIVTVCVLQTIGMLCIVANYALSQLFTDKYTTISNAIYYAGLTLFAPMMLYILTRPISYFAPRTISTQANTKPSALASFILNASIFLATIGIGLIAIAVAIYLLSNGANDYLYSWLTIAGVVLSLPAIIYIIVYMTLRRGNAIKERDEIHARLKQASKDLDAKRITLSEVEARLADYEAFMRTQQSTDSIAKEQLEQMKAEKLIIEQKLAKYEQRNSEAQKRAASLRRKNAQERKKFYTKENLDILIRQDFLPFSACFFINRDKYKDKFGLAPYNKVVSMEIDGISQPEFSMVRSVTAVYSFARNLVDCDIFMRHPNLRPVFDELIAQDISMSRICEKLHLLYLENFRQDFVGDFKKREDFDNLLILCVNRQLIERAQYSSIFDISAFYSHEFNAEQIIDYLANKELLAKFQKLFPNTEEVGFESSTFAMVACFIDLIKNQYETRILVETITKHIDRITRAVNRKLKIK